VEDLPNQLSPLNRLLEQKRGWETILLVEDEEAVRELIHTVLTEHGYHVIPARDPEHALQLVTSFAGEIHMLLTDVVMPGMSGRELANQVSQRRRNSSTVHVRLYRQRDYHWWHARKASLLQKPFSPNSLAQKLREVLAPATVNKRALFICGCIASILALRFGGGSYRFFWLA
jgi:CheY-like chemotaxis protein